jgi:hypothetical protein
MVSGWLSPLLVCASLLLLGRSFWMIYVRQVATRATTIVTWCSLVFIIGFWTWHFAVGGIWPDTMGNAPSAEHAPPQEPPAKTQVVWLQVDGMSKKLGIY